MSRLRSRDELFRAAKEANITYRVLTEVETGGIWAKVGQTFFPNEPPLTEKRILFLWDRLEDGVSIRTPLGWQLVGQYVGLHPALVLFNPNDDLTIVEFGSGQDLTAALGETFGFEFYVTDAQATYFLCFNHHEYLIGAGAAASWVAQISLDPSNVDEG